jgi:L-rhamnose-H+ transport protein
LGPNPLLGVFFHWLGGLASGSFYVPFRRVKKWAWETYWLVGGFFSWIIVPWILGAAMTNDLSLVLHEAPSGSIFWTYFFGVLWGLGGLTFGLTMRYLGMSLGMAVALGYTAAFGTLMPPIFRGQFVTQVLRTPSGLTILAGVGVCLLGIVVVPEMDGLEATAQLRKRERERGQHTPIIAVTAHTMNGDRERCLSAGMDAYLPKPIRAPELQVLLDALVGAGTA